MAQSQMGLSSSADNTREEVNQSKSNIILDKVIELVSETVIKDKIIHAFGTGHSHMIGLELFARAGGIANVNAMLDSTVMTSEGARRSAEIERISGFAKVIWDQHKIEKNDIFFIISNSGRNAMPIEMAQLAKANSNKVIAITSIDQSSKYPARIKNQNEARHGGMAGIKRKT